MSRAKRTAEAEPEAPTEVSKAPVKTVKLRLLQNAYVRGELTKARTVVEFDENEAKRRLKATPLWERI